MLGDEGSGKNRCFLIKYRLFTYKFIAQTTGTMTDTVQMHVNGKKGKSDNNQSGIAKFRFNRKGIQYNFGSIQGLLELEDLSHSHSSLVCGDDSFLV